MATVSPSLYLFFFFLQVILHRNNRKKHFPLLYDICRNSVKNLKSIASGSKYIEIRWQKELKILQPFPNPKCTWCLRPRSLYYIHILKAHDRQALLWDRRNIAMLRWLKPVTYWFYQPSLAANQAFPLICKVVVNVIFVPSSDFIATTFLVDICTKLERIKLFETCRNMVYKKPCLLCLDSLIYERVCKTNRNC